MLLCIVFRLGQRGLAIGFGLGNFLGLEQPRSHRHRDAGGDVLLIHFDVHLPVDRCDQSAGLVEDDFAFAGFFQGWIVADFFVAGQFIFSLNLRLGCILASDGECHGLVSRAHSAIGWLLLLPRPGWRRWPLVAPLLRLLVEDRNHALLFPRRFILIRQRLDQKIPIGSQQVRQIRIFLHVSRANHIACGVDHDLCPTMPRRRCRGIRQRWIPGTRIKRRRKPKRNLPIRRIRR